MGGSQKGAAEEGFWSAHRFPASSYLQSVS